MADGLQFDEEVRKSLEMAYLTPDMVAARDEVINMLSAQIGESILDIGSGPGFLAKDIAERVGSTGSVHGIDLAENMLEASRKLCVNQPWVEFHSDDAMGLSYPDEHFDAVVSTQVYEYVPNLEDALVEFARIMRPGGRGVIVDTDWAMPYWSSEDTNIRDRIVDAWTEHCAQEEVPMRLPGAIRAAGLNVKQVKAFPLMNYNFDKDAFSYWMSTVIGSFSVGRRGLTQEDIDIWRKGLENLQEKGEYFFCINRYIFEVIK